MSPDEGGGQPFVIDWTRSAFVGNLVEFGEMSGRSGSPQRQIFERRDVRVVEGARLEIALTICDGVLQISITVAKPHS